MNDPALIYLAWTAFLTALIWIPYILNMIAVRGVIDAVGYPAHPKPLAPWAERMKSAHYNAVENLVVFAPLVVAAHLMNASDATTANLVLAYLVLRLIHLAAYTFKVPWVRTLAFVGGWVCTMWVGVQVLFQL